MENEEKWKLMTTNWPRKKIRILLFDNSINCSLKLNITFSDFSLTRFHYFYIVYIEIVIDNEIMKSNEELMKFNDK